MQHRQLHTLNGAPLPLLAACAAILALHPACAVAAQGEPAPEFTHQGEQDWINSPPLQLSELRGKVVLLDVWTFECWNCYRSFPWLTDLEARLEPQGLQVIGVHSPEFEHERERAAVERKAEEFGLHHPIMLDNDFSYWRALRNRYWPAFYVIDKKGVLRGAFFGETHPGDRRARAIDALLQELLAESGP